MFKDKGLLRTYTDALSSQCGSSSVACTGASKAHNNFLYRMAHRTIGTLVLLADGTIYARTQRNTIGLSVCKRTTHVFLHRVTKTERVAIHPSGWKPRAFWQQLVSA